MMVTGATATDFVVYNPFQRIPIYIVRIEKNEDVANAIAERVRLANEFIEEKIESLTSKTINDLGYELYDVEYVKEGTEWYLRAYIDKPEGVSINDCENVSRALLGLVCLHHFQKFIYRHFPAAHEIP